MNIFFAGFLRQVRHICMKTGQNACATEEEDSKKKDMDNNKNNKNTTTNLVLK